MSESYAYAQHPEDGLGLLMAERLSSLGLQPFDAGAILKASRQVQVLVHHARLWSHALAAPLAPPPRGTRVLLALASERHDFFVEMFGTSRAENDPEPLRAFYSAAAAGRRPDEVHCQGSHLEVGVRCATNREPAFTVRLLQFLADCEDASSVDDQSFATASESEDQLSD